MVIAPLLGPNMGLSLATVLKDRDLARISITSIMIGIVIAIVVSFIIGVIVHFDPSITAITLRTDVAVGTIFLAFASGIAGSVAFTSDISSALIGVMVAVALLPPLVVFGEHGLYQPIRITDFHHSKDQTHKKRGNHKII